MLSRSDRVKSLRNSFSANSPRRIEQVSITTAGISVHPSTSRQAARRASRKPTPGLRSRRSAEATRPRRWTQPTDSDHPNPFGADAGHHAFTRHRNHFSGLHPSFSSFIASGASSMSVPLQSCFPFRSGPSANGSPESTRTRRTPATSGSSPSGWRAGRRRKSQRRWDANAAK